MKNLIYQSLLILSFFGVFVSCEDACSDSSNPSCPNYDPCHDAMKPGEDEITIEEWMDGISNTEEEGIPYCDTVLAHPRNSVAIKTQNEWGTYSWKIGTDPRTFTDNQVVLTFEDAESIVDVQLAVEEKGPIYCITDEGEKLSYSRQIVVFPSNKSLMAGSYQGALESNPVDTFTVRISAHPDPFGGSIYTYNIHNIPKGCEDIYDKMENFAGYASLRFNAAGVPAPSCQIVTGYAYLEANRRDIVIPFAVDEPGIGRKSYIFKGTRL